MKFHITVFILFSLFLISACEEESITSFTTETVVVESYLFAGQGIDSVKITQSTSYSSSDSVIATIDGVEVTVSDGTNSYPLEFIGDGLYRKLDVQAQSGLTYSLGFEHEGKTISATTYVPTHREATASIDEITMTKVESGSPPNFGEQPDPIELEWDNTEGDYYYVVVQNIEDDPEVINELFEDSGRAFRFTSEPQIMDFYAINPRREIQQFGMHHIIVFRVNPEYAALYETSGTTSTTIAQPPTNVVNGLGLFTGVSSDTLFLNVKKG